MVHIPHEILLDILLNLPSNSLVRFLLVCKSWNSIITDYDFCTLHLHHRNKSRLCWVTLSPHPDFFINDDSSAVYYRHYLSNHGYCKDSTPRHHFEYLSFYDEYFNLVASQPLPILGINSRSTIIGSCHGLLCQIVFSPWGRLCGVDITNPAIRQTKRVVSFSKPDHFVFGFGYAPQSNDYKLVIVKELSFSLSPNVYSLRKNTWVKGKTMAPDGSVFFSSEKEGLYYNGVFHWLKWNGRVVRILSFNLDREEFEYLMEPEICRQKSDYFYINKAGLLVYKDMFAISFVKRKKWSWNECESSWQVWVMKEYGVSESWMAVMTIDDLQRPGYELCSYRPLEKDTDGEIVLHGNDDCSRLTVHDQRNQNFKVLNVLAAARFFPYQESLLLLQK